MAGFETVNPDAPQYDADDEEPEELGDIETVPAAWRDDDEDDGRPEPTRHEPADMGGGETTGVQDL
jgi:hypothetical protein